MGAERPKDPAMSDTTAADIGYSILDELDNIDGGVKQPKIVFGSLLDEARHAFIETAKKEIDSVNAGFGRANKYGMPVTSWTEAETNGRYKVVLKAKGGVLTLKGKTYFYLPNKEETCKFIAMMAIAAERGELDKFLDIKKRATPQQTHNAFIQRLKQEQRVKLAEKIGYDSAAA